MAINATAVWRVRPSGSNTNGGGYDAGISGAGTDYSQQNAAQASGTHGSGTTSTFTDSTAAAFTSAMVGNAMYITGGGATTGFYFVVSYTNANTVVLDRSPGASVSGATWHLGGGWADFWTNTTANIVPGNTVYILGSGTPNPASYTYDYSPPSYYTVVSGDTTNGKITFANDPSTPGYKAAPDTTGGMPVIKSNGGLIFYVASDNIFSGLWFVAGGSGLGGYGHIDPANGDNTLVFGCVLDQFGYDTGLVNGVSQSGNHTTIGCEVFSSVSGSGTGYGIYLGGYACKAIGNNVHDTVANGIYIGSGAAAESNIVAKCKSNGFSVASTSGYSASIKNNTVDGNAGHGVEVTNQASLGALVMMNNIISNHTGVGKYGLTIDAGTTAQNNRVKPLIDYNVYYNNTSDLNAISYGTHDTHGGSNPFVGQSTENYALA